ncbi:MAG TPA: DNA primase [Candidatus Babeliales bacterium]|jgi:DNA primase|nr:DNA primase [Candidatus Babeliales bacterium]
MNIFDFIKNRIAILDVIQEYTSLKKMGTNYWKGRCPFHHEKTASFTVSPGKEIFYCFGCHVHGDVISFIARTEQCSQLEAAKYLVERYGIVLPEDEGLLQPNNQEKDRYHSICTLVAQWAHQQLLKNKQICAYLESRFIAAHSITDYMIGYFPGGTAGLKELLAYAKQKNLLSQDLLNAHIITQGHVGLYCPFEERIVFPIKDHLSRVCGFGGRIFNKQDTRSKYYNTKDHDFFSKGSLLFGFDRAKSAIQSSETVFLVEGYFDCIAMVQAGFLNTVATLGTACTIHHLKQISRYAHTVYIVYDGDRAGHDAVLRLTALCWQVNMELKIVSLPAGCDPASFYASGGNVADLIKNAQDLFLFYINDIGITFATKPLSKKLEDIKGLMEAIANIEDQLKRDLLLQEASQKLNILFEILKKEVARIRQKSSQVSVQNEIPSKTPSCHQSPLRILEKTLVCAILNHIEVLCEQNVRYLGTYLPKPFGDIVRRIFIIKKNGDQHCFRTFFSSLNKEQQEYISKLALSCPDVDKERFFILYKQWQRHLWKVIVADIKSKIMQAHNEGNHQGAVLLLEEFALLKKDMLQVSEFSKEQ